MISKGKWVGLSLVAAILMLLVIGHMLVTASVREAVGAPSNRGAELTSGIATLALPMELRSVTADVALSQSILSSQDASAGESPLSRSLLAPDDVIEVFTNTWSYSTIGLVYDPGRDLVRYGHESQSSTHNATVYDVDRGTHSMLGSFAPSMINSGWPWQIDNRDGGGYDFYHGTYFLPDYNGDLSYSDDNIIEVDAAGVVLNAWELDDEVGSNDSSDGSEIDSVIDIAVVPGSPTRYFVTAAYDGSVVYEIALTRTGTWWTPNSWHTVATYTLPVFSDNLGIDWDAEHEVLFHSGWHTTTILITDLGMNPVTEVDAAFDCPGAGGYNSGVTYIEGSDPTEVWVTDFSSDKTTRCGTPFTIETPPPAWGKWVAGEPWAPGLSVETETADVVLVSDVITAVQAFTLTEAWDPAHLELLDVEVIPPVGMVISATDFLEIAVPAGPPEVATIEKRFFVRPCDWTESTLEEVLEVEGGPPFDPRAVQIQKQPSELHIESGPDAEVYAGGLVSVTLEYSNAGGYENDVKIRSTFPITVPFLYGEPFPDEVGPDGSWARWDTGNLAHGDTGSIDVYVLIDETLPTSRTIGIWAGIFDHLDVLREESGVEFHVNEQVFPVAWDKSVDELPWAPDLAVTLQTSDTLVIQETIGPSPDGFTLFEEWNPDELELLPVVSIDPEPELPAQVVSMPGYWALVVPPGSAPVPVTIVKEFHVSPCNWPETVLWEALQVADAVQHRPVIAGKVQPALWIDGFFDEAVYGGDEAHFQLNYGNAGGFENQAWIRSDFPPEAPFVGSDPAPFEADPGGRWAIWNGGSLATDATGVIDVGVQIEPGLPPSSTIGIWSGILDHAQVVDDETGVTFHIPAPTWDKWVNGLPWNPDLGVVVRTFDTITVTDIIATQSGMAMVEHWNPNLLRLDRYDLDPSGGIILSDPGFLSWEFPDGAPGTVALTKVFRVLPTDITYSVLWEELWVEGIEWERRPVHVDRVPGTYVYLPLVMRDR